MNSEDRQLLREVASEQSWSPRTQALVEEIADRYAAGEKFEVIAIAVKRARSYVNGLHSTFKKGRLSLDVLTPQADAHGDLTKLGEAIQKKHWEVVRTELKKRSVKQHAGSDPHFHLRYAALLAYEGKFAEALVEIEKARTLADFKNVRVEVLNRRLMGLMEFAPLRLAKNDAGKFTLQKNPQHVRWLWNFERFEREVVKVAKVADDAEHWDERWKVGLNGVLGAVLNRKSKHMDEYAARAYGRLQRHMRTRHFTKYQSALSTEKPSHATAFAAALRQIGLYEVCRGEAWCESARHIGMKERAND